MNQITTSKSIEYLYKAIQHKKQPPVAYILKTVLRYIRRLLPRCSISRSITFTQVLYKEISTLSPIDCFTSRQLCTEMTAVFLCRFALVLFPDEGALRIETYRDIQCDNGIYLNI
jgi:hypothetical protein